MGNARVVECTSLTGTQYLKMIKVAYEFMAEIVAGENAYAWVLEFDTAPIKHGQ